MYLLVRLFPLHDPVYIFAVLAMVIFLSPFIFRIIKIPDIASYILAGILIGPYGFHILDRDSSIELLGTVGLLYIMFIAGLELDPEKLKSSRKNSMLFGALTFIFPFVLGFLVSRYVLQLQPGASYLVAIMFSTHTLVAYPIVRKLGINEDLSVLTAIGGTIITDTLVLLVFSIATQSFIQGSYILQVAKLLGFFALYLFIIFYTYPRISKWFFRNVKRDRPVHFLFVLLLVGISSALAELAGVEAIIGAFVAGLALNRSIPRNSLLMHHVDFVGNILFIPFFLIGIGMLINTRVLFSGPDLLYISATLILSALAGKWIAAYISQKILGFDRDQRNLLFGLTSSHAAATIAIILIGYNKQLIDENIFNATILIILVSSLLASFITEKYGKRMVLAGRANRQDLRQTRILVPISNPATMNDLVSLAGSLQDKTSIDPVYVFSIVTDDVQAGAKLAGIRSILEKNVEEYNNLQDRMKVITRVDLNVSNGILRAAKEYLITDIVFGYPERITPSQKIFGSIFDHLLKSSQTLYSCNFKQALGRFRHLVCVLPPGIEREARFTGILEDILKLPLGRDHVTKILMNPDQEKYLLGAGWSKHFRNTRVTRVLDVPIQDLSISPDTLIVLFYSRKESVAFNAAGNAYLQKYYLSHKQYSYLFIVPGTARFI